MVTKNYLIVATTLAAFLSTVAGFAAEQLALKDVFKGEFRVGAAISTPQILGDEPQSLAIVVKQFNSITPENLLKWEGVHPRPEEFTFEPADRFVEFCEKNQMFSVGHTLVWHNQTPPWVFADDSGKALDRDTLLDRMQSHIKKVVGRYKGKINGWDVVNEAIDDDGTMRKSKWQQIIGDDFVEKAFQFANESDPSAELYYNDYNEWKPEKREGIKRLVRSLQAKNIRIDGIGLQGHWGLDYPSAQEIEAMFDDYGTLGVKLKITELDITVLPDANRTRGADISRNEAARKELDPYHDALPEDMQRRLADRYAEIFRLFVKHADKIDRVTFWGVHDGQSWRNYWPVRGRSDYPMLFDRQLKTKPAYDAVIKTAPVK